MSLHFLNMYRIYLIAVLCIGMSLCQVEDNMPDLSDISKNFPDLPINKSNIPSIEEAQKILKEKCIKNAGEGAYENLMSAREKVEECLRSQINVTVLQDEVEDAKPTGDLDLVFSKYCKKTPTILECIKNLTNVAEHCLEAKEKDSMKVVLNVTESLANFVCFKDGDRIAMFIAEGGFECLTDQQEAVQRCVNTTLGSKIPTEMPSINNLPLFLIEAKECEDMVTLQNCVVAELENCKEPTPANIVESLFKFIKRVTPCNNIESKSKASEIVAEKSSGASVNPNILGVGLILSIASMYTQLL